MTTGQFFLGLVTLVVATFVYRWQKNVDRETVSLAELRELLSRYAVLSHRLYLSQPYRDQEYSKDEIAEFFGISNEEIELYTLRDQIYVSAPQQVREAVLECDETFRKWKIGFPRDSSELNEMEIATIRELGSCFKFKHEAMLIAMRGEFMKHSQNSVPLFLSRIFRADR